MAHYSEYLLNPVTVQRVSDGSRFYPGVPNTPNPFVYNGSVDVLKAMLDNGDYTIVSGANTLAVVTLDLVTQEGIDPELDYRTQLFLSKYLANGVVPNVPSGVTATAGDSQVSVTWFSAGGASSYNIKRSTVSGSETTLITGITSVTYSDTTVTNGTTYYYKVSAVNVNGESANSSEVSATPASATFTFTQGGHYIVDTLPTVFLH